MHVKIKIYKTALKLLYIIDYLLFNSTKWDINLWKNSITYAQPTLTYGHFKVRLLLLIVFYSSNTCKNQNLKNSFKIVVHH